MVLGEDEFCLEARGLENFQLEVNAKGAPGLNTLKFNMLQSMGTPLPIRGPAISISRLHGASMNFGRVPRHVGHAHAALRQDGCGGPEGFAPDRV